MIVDEEQRFGVKQKELLRQLKLKVDVLSLSATPIPRTLQMCLAGLRDISVIETPPEGRRPVRTYVGPYDEELVGAGDQARGGARGPGLLPPQPDRHPARGRRAPARALSRACASPRPTGRWTRASSRRRCSRFLRGDADCLVATTIIESGLDIPQANTLIVERADQLGLAQAYQIRGRVGRSRERAFAYMLYPSEEALSRRRRRPARDALRPHRARLGVRDRDARPRAARRRRPARRRAVRATSPRSASSSTSRCSTRRSRSCAPRGEGEARSAPRRRCASTSTSTPTCRPSTSPSRRRRSTSTAGSPAPASPGELRALRDELRDRFGPVPEPVANLLALQRARIELGTAGAAHGRGPRRAALDHPARARRDDRRPAARADPRGDLRAPRTKTLSLRVARRARPSGSRPCSGSPRRWRRRSRRAAGSREPNAVVCCRPRESAGKEGQARAAAARRPLRARASASA